VAEPSRLRRPLRRIRGTRRPASLRKVGEVVFGVTAVILVAAIVVGAVLEQRVRHDRNLLLERVDPATAALGAWENAVVGESLAARAFALSGRSGYAALYRASASAAARARTELTGDVAGMTRTDGAVRSLDAAVTAWQVDYAGPEASGAVHGPQAAGELARSADALSALRRDFALVGRDLASAHRRAVSDFDTSLTIAESFAGVVLAGMAALLAALYLALRFGVLAPLQAVGEDSRRVTEGELDHKVRRTGPAEIAALAEDIEDMRAAVVADLHGLETTHAELARSNRDLEQFAYVASHDLQEPLRKVASFCQLLADRYSGQLDERAEQYIAFAVDGARRMQTLVNDLLSFSRVGRSRERWERVDLGACLAAAMANLDARITETATTVSVLDELPEIDGDRSLLSALWQNLLSNSIKFRAGADPLVTVTCRREGSSWELVVADNGIGIEPEYAERVFTIFQRLHTRERYDGTGIGLALCRKIVEFHGGTISVDPHPSPQGGTSIRFTLPVAGDDGAAATSETDEETVD
jgi:signal transduction histidine kinase